MVKVIHQGKNFRIVRKESKADKALNSVKRLRRQIPLPEKKVLTTAQIATSYTTTASFQLLNGLAQGDTVNTRDGMEVSLRDLVVSGWAKGHASEAYQHHRFIWFYDKQPNGAAPAVTDLLEANNTSAPYNYINANRFQILKDVAFVTSNIEGQFIKPFRMRIPLKRQKVKYSGTAATVASIAKHSLYFMYFVNTSTNQPVLNLYHQLKYQDN